MVGTPDSMDTGASCAVQIGHVIPCLQAASGVCHVNIRMTISPCPSTKSLLKFILAVAHTMSHINMQALRHHTITSYHQSPLCVPCAALCSAAPLPGHRRWHSTPQNYNSIFFRPSLFKPRRHSCAASAGRMQPQRSTANTKRANEIKV